MRSGVSVVIVPRVELTKDLYGVKGHMEPVEHGLREMNNEADAASSELQDYDVSSESTSESDSNDINSNIESLEPKMKSTINHVTWDLSPLPAICHDSDINSRFIDGDEFNYSEKFQYSTAIEDFEANIINSAKKSLKKEFPNVRRKKSRRSAAMSPSATNKKKTAAEPGSISQGNASIKSTSLSNRSPEKIGGKKSRVSPIKPAKKKK